MKLQPWLLLLPLVGLCACPGGSDDEAEAPKEPRRVELDTRLGFELSGVARVPHGLLLVDDELVGSVMFVSWDSLEAGAPTAELVKLERKRSESRPHTEHTKLFANQDFEDIAAGPDGETVYLLASHHGREKDGVWERRLDRELIVRAEWKKKKRELVVRAPRPKENQAKRKLGVYTALVDHLRASHGEPVVRGLNCEGLAVEGKRLYVGLRAPLSEAKRALIFHTALESLFDVDEAEEFTGEFDRIELDLEGSGVRGLFYDEQSEKLLVLSGPVTDDQRAPIAVWAYDLGSKKLARIHTFEDPPGVPEGICRYDAHELLVVIDAERAQKPELVRLPWSGK